MLVHCARAAGRRHAPRRCVALASSSHYATTSAPPLLSSRCPAAETTHVSRSKQIQTVATTVSIRKDSHPPPPPPPPPPHHPEQQQEQQQQPPSSHPPPPSHEQQQQQQSRRRTRRRILFGAAFLLLGSTLGSAVRAALAPPDLPAPGTDKDRYLLAAIADKAAKLPLHKQLSSDPAWQSWDAYEAFTPSSSSSSPDSLPATGAAAAAAGATTTTTGTAAGTSGPSLTAHTLSGSRALAYQRIFHNPATHELVSIVYLGASIAGWPGVVHGGAIATVLDETLGRCAVRMFPARTGVTANLEMDYKAPTRTEGFYVIRVRPVPLPEEEEVEGAGKGKGEGRDKDKGNGKGDRKRWVVGSLERMDGTVCVKAKALFVVPKGVKLGPIADRY